MGKSLKNVLVRQLEVSDDGKEPEGSNCEALKKKGGYYS